MRLCLKLKFLRNAQGYTQQDMADYLGVQKTTYTHYEKGDRNPDYAKLLKISKRFFAPIQYLLDDNSPVVIQQECPKDLLDEFERIINEIVVTNDYIKNSKSCGRLQKVHNSVIDVLCQQMKTPIYDDKADSFNWEVFHAGDTVLTICLDARAEKLMKDSLKLQGELLKYHDIY